MNNIKTAVFNRTDTARVYGLWQWDYGQVLRIQGLSLDPAVEIHFSLSERGGESTPRIGVTQDGVTDVEIPNEMLKNEGCTVDYYIYAWVYTTDETSGQTEKKIIMHVKSRPKTGEETIDTPEDRTLFREAIAAVNESAVDARNAEKSAEAWAHGDHENYPERDEDNAAYYAGVAGENADSAYDSLAETKRLASQVHSDADATAQNTSLAEQYKAQAAQSAANALLFDQAAKSSETAAQEARTGAETAEGNAEMHALDAAASASGAELAKTQAQENAQQVSEDRDAVQKLSAGFSLTCEKAIRDINTAGENQVNAVDEAGQKALENIGTGIDNTLSVEGKAADAGATGKAIDELKSDLANINEYASNGYNVISVTPYTHTDEASNRLASNPFNVIPNRAYRFIVDSNWSIGVTSEDRTKGWGDWTSGEFEYTLSERITGNAIIRCKKNSDENIDDSDVQNNIIVLMKSDLRELAEKSDNKLTDAISDISKIKSKETAELSTELSSKVNTSPYTINPTNRIISSNFSVENGDVFHIDVKSGYQINLVSSDGRKGIDWFSESTDVILSDYTVGDWYFRIRRNTDETIELSEVWDNIITKVPIIKTVNAIDGRIDSAFMSRFNSHTCNIFKQVCCIGDSYTEGYIVDSKEVAHSSNKDYAWTSYMEKITGNKYLNFGVSGSTTKTWINHARGGQIAFLPENKSQAYIIGLQINDRQNTPDNVPVGSISDIGTTNQTYYGCMSAIVERCIDANAYAHVFIQTCPTDSSVAVPYNNAIHDIVEHYRNVNNNVHCLDLFAHIDLYKNKSLTDSLVGGHSTPVGYEQFAEILSYVMSEYINNHATEFRDVAFIDYYTSN